MLASVGLLGAGTMTVLGATGDLPNWAATPLGWGTVVVFLVLIMTGKLRPEREVLAAEASREEWKANHQLEVEARQAAERAAVHVIDSASRDTAFIDAIRELAGTRRAGGA